MSGRGFQSVIDIRNDSDGDQPHLSTGCLVESAFTYLSPPDSNTVVVIHETASVMAPNLNILSAETLFLILRPFCLYCSKERNHEWLCKTHRLQLTAKRTGMVLARLPTDALLHVSGITSPDSHTASSSPGTATPGALPEFHGAVGQPPSCAPLSPVPIWARW